MIQATAAHKVSKGRPGNAGRSFATVERRWPESTIVCLASGPSLTLEDVEWCKGKAPVIAVNDTHTWAPWADVLYSSDQRWWAFYQGVPVFQGLKFGIHPLTPHPAWGVGVLRNGGTGGLSADPSKLCSGMNSGYAAINLAIHLGASRVVLLGYDMGRMGRRNHFFGEHPTRLRSGTPYHRFVQRFASMVEPLKQAGVSVINCSRATQLTMFERRPLAEVLW